MNVGLRDFDIREFLKKNFDFVMGIFSEIGFVLILVVASLLISLLLSGFRI